MNRELLQSLRALAQLAGERILEDKSRTSSVSLKADESPLTSADLVSNQTILAGLYEIDKSIPVLSEESVALPYAERGTWTRYFLVDPLDGTKEFIKGKDEYTVNIALVENGVPIAGVVYVPELALSYSGAVGLGSFKAKGNEEPQRISVAKETGPVSRIVGSSSHASPVMAGLLELLGPHEILCFGSSLKLCQVADGTAHFYPRFGPTSEWDTAAGHAVVLYAGGRVVTLDGSPLTYNQKDSVLNPPFFVLGPEDRDYLGLARQVLET